MRIADRLLRLAAAVALAAIASSAAAGGPLIVDPVTRKAWVYGPGTVPVFYDLGNFAVVSDWNNYPAQVTLDNAAGAAVVRKGFTDWSSIPTSSLRAQVRGDFASIGLPDIDGSNAGLVIGTFNGGGIHVIFDTDGSVMENFFGVGPNVLGISSPELADEATGYITESWTVLNGQAVSFDDVNAAQYQGVATHEFGHSVGLAHTQTSGGAYYFGPVSGESVGPQSCTALPYRTDVTSADVETMNPFANPTPPNGTGIALANIHTTDDKAAISDLYPAPGWPSAFGTISGKVLDVDGKTPLTGVNVIARNLDDPFTDASSTLTGAWTQGQFGADGTYTFHGLKPGGRYVVYVDAIVAGGYPTPPLWFLPGAERFYAGAGGNSGNSQPFDPCAYQAITARAGKIVQADIAFERVRGAPVLLSLGYGAGGTAITGDGSTVVGNYGRGGPPFRWTEKTGVVPMDVSTTGDMTNISRNGKYVSTTLLDASGTNIGAFRWDVKSGWLPVDPVGACGTDTTTSFGVADDGAVFGLAYNTCDDFKPFRWTPKTGTKLFPTATRRADGTPASGRMTRISSDGSVLAGWEANYDWVDPLAGDRLAVVWVNGVPSQVKDANGLALNEVWTVSGDGKVIGGGLFAGQAPLGNGWRKRVDRPDLEYFAPLSPDASPANPYSMNRDGSVMAGFSGDPFFSWDPAPMLWTTEMGSVDLDQFLQRQGTAMEQYVSLWSPMAFSDDGTVLTGWGIGVQGYAGWVLRIPKAFVCHLERDEKGEGHTVSASFPKGFDEHLKHGDAIGPCPNHQE